MKKSIVTTINDENAATLHFLSKQIIDGTLSNPIQYVIQCNKQTSLLFEYVPDNAYLVIEKKGEKIAFEFAVHQYKTKENGQIVVKRVQSGLYVFAKTLQAYLVAVGADRLQSELSEEGFGESQTKISSSAWI